MSEWTLFLDSTRAPPYGAVVARSVAEAKFKCLKRGVPEHLVLEFFLGLNQLTGLDFAKWLVKLDQDTYGQFIPKHFTFYVHSQNKEGKEAIETLLNNYLENRRKTYLNLFGVEERRDRRSKEYFLEERRSRNSKRSQGRIVWGNLEGSDYAKHTRHRLIHGRRSH